MSLTEERVKVAPGATPEPGSQEELGRFAALQERLGPLSRKLAADPRAPQTVVVVSISPQAPLSKSRKA